jgi:hypothetical protein
MLQRRLPSILAKTLPPSAMGCGWKGAGAAVPYWSDISFIIKYEDVNMVNMETFPAGTLFFSAYKKSLKGYPRWERLLLFEKYSKFEYSILL